MALAEQILAELGIAHGWKHTGSKRALVSWMHAESGEQPGLCNGIPGQGAAWNPLNTTLNLGAGCTSAHNYNSVPVRNYLSQECGARAVANTLLHTPDQGYEAIVAALAKPFNTVKAINRAIDASGWGTHLALLTAAASAYAKNRTFYNTYSVGP